MSRLAGVLVLGISLVMPVSLASAQEQSIHHHHEWSEQEKAHWEEWEKEHHKKERAWDHATKREQKSYWKWRDKHPD
jgi:hypothetical protein